MTVRMKENLTYDQLEAQLVAQIVSYKSRRFNETDLMLISIHVGHRIIRVRGPIQCTNLIESEAIQPFLFEYQGEVKQPRVMRRAAGLDIILYGWMPSEQKVEELLR